MRLLPALLAVGRNRRALTYPDSPAPPSHRFNRSCVTRMGNFFSPSASQSEVINQVKDTISENCVVIFSKSTCPYCTMAKESFNDLNVSYKVVELDQVAHGNQIQTVLHKMTGAQTVPRVFVNGSCIGGGTETRKLKDDGKLLDLVQQCGIRAGS